MQQVKNFNPVKSHELVMYLMDDFLNQYIESVNKGHNDLARAQFINSIPKIKKFMIQVDELIDDYNTYISNEKLFIFMNC